MLRRQTLTLLSALPLALAGCAGGPTTRGSSSGAPAPGGWFGSGLSPALEAQRARLQDALRGTPVVVEATGQRQLRVAVPTKHAFDAGRSAVKPALAAVLDQFAIGFKPFAASTELRIAVPVDDRPNARLLKDRGASARDYLVARGVPRSRIGPADRPAEGALEIVVSDIAARP